jgi:transposase InsO family protein
MASVMDMASRRVLGFALGEHHDAQLAYSALVMAVAVRGGQVPGVIMHTDRGSEYTAGLVRQACRPGSPAGSDGASYRPDGGRHDGRRDRRRQPLSSTPRRSHGPGSSHQRR